MLKLLGRLRTLLLCDAASCAPLSCCCALCTATQVAEAEAAFLKSLHQVAQLSAQMQQLASAAVPKDTAAWQVTRQTQALWKEATGLSATHKQQKQVGRQRK